MYRFGVELDGGWSFGEGINSGYLQWIAAEAAARVAEHADPIAITTDFLVPARGGAATLRAEPLRLGNSIDTIRVTMLQDDALVLTASVAIGTLDGKPADMDMSAPADVPSPDYCSRIESDSLRGRRLPLMDRVEIRLAPEWSRCCAARATAASRSGAGRDSSTDAGWTHSAALPSWTRSRP